MSQFILTCPDPTRLHPLDGFTNTVFLKPLLEHESATNITVGAYSYYHDFDDPRSFFRRNVRYNFGFSGTRLRIGKYCAIGHGATILMADANHPIGGVTGFPFAIFGQDWADPPLSEYPRGPVGDIVIGNDVWIGYEATILPGAQIGNGVIIGAKAVVGGTIPDYAVVVGNPGQVVKMRFDDATIARLNRLAWWDWSAETVALALPALIKGDVAELESFCP